MKKTFSIWVSILLLSLSYGTSLAQYEIGITGGGSYYIGDLNPYKHFNQLHASGGIFLRNNLNRRFAWRLSATYGMVSGADSLSSNPNLASRNLSFRSRIIEIGPIVEMTFVKFSLGNITDESATLYLFTGLMYFNMNPQGKLNDNWVDLQSLGTEGQGSSLNSKKEYSLNQLSIPFGIGMKGNISKRICIGLEYGIRKTFTDYLDDVSGYYVDPTDLARENGPLSAHFANQSSDGRSLSGTLRGNPNNKDWYAYLGGSISVRLGKTNKCYSFSSKRN
ncbi:MAG: hypothetical protein K1X56_02470 [Flavobacteriales bacterium]|nr:hypothetical protein [Flavobacteriales bacterium]